MDILDHFWVKLFAGIIVGFVLIIISKIVIIFTESQMSKSNELIIYFILLFIAIFSAYFYFRMIIKEEKENKTKKDAIDHSSLLQTIYEKGVESYKEREASKLYNLLDSFDIDNREKEKLFDRIISGNRASQSGEKPKSNKYRDLA